jgi:hypothetical protein
LRLPGVDEGMNNMEKTCANDIDCGVTMVNFDLIAMNACFGIAQPFAHDLLGAYYETRA